MTELQPFRCERLGPDCAAAVAALLEQDSSGCYCRYWHFRGDKNEWLMRCVHSPEDNRAEFLEQASQPGLRGMAALTADGAALGWMKLTPHAQVSKLYDQRIYKNLPCFSGAREGTYTVGCFVIDHRFRRQGIARALLRAGIAEARRDQATSIEAFPRRAQDVSDAELWTGPLSLFLGEGFQIVNDFQPYPVLRLEL